ncbi:MAG: hypothetical protein HOO67_05455 [Candidatus Peribacteraceae bacterium]|nr:hypothetical protein [Candidatus Peribacteraceae bacterium]
MATKITDKRGLNRPDETTPQSPSPASAAAPSAGPVKLIIEANADGSIKEQVQPEVLLLTPFPDGMCLKMVSRPWPGKPEDKPAGYDANPQFTLVNSAKQPLAIVRDAQVAHLFCDAVNMLFVAQSEHDRLSREQHAEVEHLTNAICKGNVTQ